VPVYPPALPPSRSDSLPAIVYACTHALPPHYQQLTCVSLRFGLRLAPDLPPHPSDSRMADRSWSPVSGSSVRAGVGRRGAGAAGPWVPSERLRDNEAEWKAHELGPRVLPGVASSLGDGDTDDVLRPLGSGGGDGEFEMSWVGEGGASSSKDAVASQDMFSAVEMQVARRLQQREDQRLDQLRRSRSQGRSRTGSPSTVLWGPDRWLPLPFQVRMMTLMSALKT
jgi:hypothetical protein